MKTFGPGFFSAWRAGWIAARCKTGCFADDETETIFPCEIHKAEIARLAAINESKQK